MKVRHLGFIVLLSVLLSGCNYADPDSRSGFFYNTFAKPMDLLLDWLGTHLNYNYGLAIIIVVLTIRFVMLPFMLSQTKQGQIMKRALTLLKPELAPIQEKMKHAKTQEDRIQANQEMMAVYKKYQINPMQNMLGCLPMLVQMPILFGLYAALKWPVYNHITTYPDFLWFKLSEPDIVITIIAAVLYFLQSLVSLQNMPKDQKQMGYMLMFMSPIFIIFVTLTSASALGLYWSVSALFLVVQMYLANQYYAKLADQKMATLQQEISKNDTTKKTVKTVKRKKK
ncbi:membrane protein insertase YidC [Staphylococcus americanisciuri]|uniref:Membrane protein insertase YidC n=1 Tax=Staphylococcus americanisciuri TaxID=2973940 RepID=A0ABT2F3S3_9STAP|nr:membrane protein insertase YidC [Staphylococcus americanisciuri]MCS4487129.1 membrane protein insertase YidC [Staphylococcus americanisciuri]